MAEGRNEGVPVVASLTPWTEDVDSNGFALLGEPTIFDTEGNEILAFQGGGFQNYLQIRNSNTSSPIVLTPVGGELNAGIRLMVKGTEDVLILGTNSRGDLRIGNGTQFSACHLDGISSNTMIAYNVTTQNSGVLASAGYNINTTGDAMPLVRWTNDASSFIAGTDSADAGKYKMGFGTDPANLTHEQIVCHTNGSVDMVGDAIKFVDTGTASVQPTFKVQGSTGMVVQSFDVCPGQHLRVKATSGDPAAEAGIQFMVDSTDEWKVSNLSGDTSLRMGFSNHSSNITPLGVSNFHTWTRGGAGLAAVDNAGVFQTLSDVSSKENIADISYGLDAVMQLQPREYDSISSGKHSLGLVAQEVEDILPELIGGIEDSDTKTMSYSGVIPVLVKAIQELKAQLDAK